MSRMVAHDLIKQVRALPQAMHVLSVLGNSFALRYKDCVTKIALQGVTFQEQTPKGVFKLGLNFARVKYRCPKRGMADIIENLKDFYLG